MAAIAPSTFMARQRKRGLEAHQAMSKALKEHRFADALENARTALALDPNNIMLKEFVRLLEEKAELDATDDEDEDDVPGAGTSGAAEPKASAGAADSDESEEDEDEDEDEEDEGEEGAGEEEEGESSEEDEEEVPDAAVIKALKNLRMGEPADLTAPRKPLMTATKRRAIKAALGKSIKELQEAELASKMMAADPLLGA